MYERNYSKLNANVVLFVLYKLTSIPTGFVSLYFTEVVLKWLLSTSSRVSLRKILHLVNFNCPIRECQSEGGYRRLVMDTGGQLATCNTVEEEKERHSTEHLGTNYDFVPCFQCLFKDWFSILLYKVPGNNNVGLLWSVCNINEPCMYLVHAQV